MLWAAALAVLPFTSWAAPKERAPDPALVEAGRRIYRDGLGVDGNPIAATVQGDIPVQGAQFTCAHCHRRSAMGSREGNRIVPGVAWGLLTAKDSQRKRKPYSEATLLRAVREGLRPDGAALDPLMPRFRLSPADEAALLAYLKTRTTGPEPGVTPKDLRVATVIGPEAPPAEADALLRLLTSWLAEKNAQTRGEVQRKKIAPFHERIHLIGYRHWVLSVWRLKGKSDTWAEQLDALQKAEPAFAVLTGVFGGGDMGGLHAWCNARRVPCILPQGRRVPTDAANEYVFYGTAGASLDAWAMARQRPAGRGVVQVAAPDTAGADAAAAFRAVSSQGLTDVSLTGDWQARLAARRAAGDVAILWLDAEQLATARELTADAGHPVFLSGTLLDGTPVPAALAPGAFVADPYLAAGEESFRLMRFDLWRRGRGLSEAGVRVQAQAWFACGLAREGLDHMKKWFVRDYLLDLLDEAAGATHLAPLYPRLVFTPGQRYLQRGVYWRDVAAKRATWIVPDVPTAPPAQP